MKTKIGTLLTMLFLFSGVLGLSSFTIPWTELGNDGRGGEPIEKYYGEIDIKEVKYKISEGLLYFKISTEKEWSIPQKPVERWYIDIALDTKKGGQHWWNDFTPDYHLIVSMNSEGAVESKLIYYDETATPHELGKLDSLDITGNTIELGVKISRIEKIEREKIGIAVLGAYEDFQTTQWKQVDLSREFFIPSKYLGKKIEKIQESERKVEEEKPEKITGLVIYKPLDPISVATLILVVINLVLTGVLAKKLTEPRKSEEKTQEIPL